MATVQNREEFIQYCLRKLGHPVVQVNVAVEQVEDRVTEALSKFYERHYDAVEEFVALYVISDADITNGYIEMPPEWVAVTDVSTPSIQLGASSMEYQAFINELYSTTRVSSWGSMQYYYVQRSYFSLINRFFVPEKSFNFNKLTHRLHILGGLQSTANSSSVGIMIRGFKKVYGEVDDGYSDSNIEIHNIWVSRWLQNYATALIKYQWATNMSKYQNIQLLGGVSMNGGEIMAQALEEINKLEEELYLAYELPPIGFLG